MNQYKFRIYNKRHDGEITYTVTKTETGWHIQHITINGDCGPDGSPLSITALKEPPIVGLMEPVGSGGFGVSNG